VALRNGTMGWDLAGLTCEQGKARRAPAPSGAGIAWAQAAARRVAARLGIARIDEPMLARFRAEADHRTLYLFDVRDPSEYEAGHMPGAVSAPGGQLVQATDHYVGTLGARIVLADDKEARASMTASWLRQMGWQDIFVLAASGNETGWPKSPVLGDEPPGELQIGCAELSAALAQGHATVVDLSSSRNYLKAHIGGAWFAIRARLDQALQRIPAHGMLVLTSEDGVLAGLAASEALALCDRQVRYLPGGNAAWRTAGHALTGDDPRFADEPLDVWVKPYERAADKSKAMADYLAWEVDLMASIERDGCAAFSAFPR
jgi:3-mercaptopyruvate sulfurtransferase SseA